MLVLLRQRNVALLWFGGLVSMAGDLALITALPFYVYQQTGSTLASAGMVMATVVPSFLFGSVAGVFADRWDRRRTMVLADLGRAALLLLLLLVRSGEWLWLVYGVTFVQSTISQFRTPAENALFPRLVGDEHLAAGNALNALNNNLARMIGPALGGALLGLAGLWSVVLVDIASYLLSALLLTRIDVPSSGISRGAPGSPTRDSATSMWDELCDGLRLVRHEYVLAVVFMVAGMASLAGGIQEVLLVAFVNDIVGGGAQTFGWALTAQGLGGLIGGWIIGQVSDAVRPARLLGVSLAAVGLIFFVEVNLPYRPLFVLLVFLISPPVVGWGIGQQTLLQSCASDRYRGRIFGALATATALLSLIGIGLAGAIGQRLGVVFMLNATAGLYLLAGALALALLREAKTAAEHPACAAEEGKVATG